MDTRKSPYAKVCSLPFEAFDWTDGFHKERLADCAENTVPHLQKMFESREISHVLENFRIAAGEAGGEFDGTVFGDGDFYKWMESAVYTAAKTDNQAMLDKLEDYVSLIAKAQQPDGYLSTKQIIGEKNGNGIGRLGDINDFEVYNFGHLFTCACLYRRVTGRDSLLSVAERAAGYLEKLYEDAERSGDVQTAVCPSHYMGLVELYRTTKDQRYLRLAHTAVRLRDSVKDGTDDNQDRLPLKQQDRIVGHAVRSNYLYAGVADLYAEEGDPDYLEVLHKVWRNLADTKVYITGGCGALYNGASPYGNFFIHQLVHQAYGYEYQLPNVTAYNETCASLGGMFWAWRMFHIEPRAEYVDMLERMLLNVNLAAVSLDGKKFFYENMLRREKKLPYELIWGQERSEYILSYCCPPNLARTIAQMGEYAYAVDEDGVWTGIYGSSRARLDLPDGVRAVLVQSGGYPFDGNIDFTFEEIEQDAPLTLHLRIPGWASGGVLTVNGCETRLSGEQAGSYLNVSVERLQDASVTLTLDMPVRYTQANPKVEEDNYQAAVERGPLVYCIESPDADVETLNDLILPLQPDLQPVPYVIGGKRMTALQGHAYRVVRGACDPEALYQRFSFEGLEETPIRMIPYYAWDNRGFGEMKIWMPVAYR